MSWNPNQGQDPNQPGQYGGYTPPPANDPYGAQQGGYQQGAYQQPPFGQQPYSGYQQPYGAPPAGAAAAASTLGPTSMGMQANVAAGLSYLAGWITGLIFFLGEKQNRFVRFHALQSLLLSVGLIVLYIVVWVLDIIFLIANIGFLAVLFGFLFWLLGLAAFAIWIVLLINAFQGKYFKLPVIGDFAEKHANPTM